MRDQEIVGKKIFNRETEIGKVVDTKKVSPATKVAIVDVGNNSFKAVPLEFIDEVADRLSFSGHKSLINNSPSLTSRDIENNPDKLKQIIAQHFGEPDNWQNRNDEFDASKGDAYMGSHQITDQEPSDNRSLKEEMDYDKIKRGKEGDT